MESGAITQYVDVAQLVLYLFWIFFFGLVIYLTMNTPINIQNIRVLELSILSMWYFVILFFYPVLALL